MTMKRIGSMVLSVCILLSLCVTGVSAATYQDTDGHWAQDAITKWSESGIIMGSDGYFNPDDSITRGDMAVILDRLMSYQTQGENTFADLGDTYYTDAILKLNAVGVIIGSDGYCRPEDPITRQEAATMLCRAFYFDPQNGATGFYDNGDIEDWARGYVNTLYSKGYVTGKPGNYFDPYGNITRAEAVQMIDNIVVGYYTQGGTYQTEEDGIVIIKAGNVTLTGKNISDHVIVAPPSNTVNLDQLQINGSLIVASPNAKVYLTGNTSTSFAVLTNQASNALIDVGEEAAIDYVASNAPGVTIDGDGVVNNVDINASSSSVLVGGANVNVGADAFGTLVGYKIIAPGATASVPEGGGGGVNLGGNGTTTYTVAFNSNGGSDVNSQKVEKGDRVRKPSDPQRSGYEFVGWYKDRNLSTEYTFGTKVNSNFTLYAKWNALTDLELEDTTVTMQVGDEPVLVGFTYTESRNDNTIDNADFAVTSSAEGIVAAQVYAPADATPSVKIVPKAVGTSYVTITAEKDGYQKQTATIEVTVQEKPIVYYDVVFDSKGGSAVESQSVAEGGKAVKPADPTKEGFTFAGWFTDEGLTQAFNFDTPVTGPITLYAKWDAVVTPIDKVNSAADAAQMRTALEELAAEAGWTMDQYNALEEQEKNDLAALVLESRGEGTYDSAAAKTAFDTALAEISTGIAKIGYHYYASIADAIGAAQENDTILLLDSVTANDQITLDKNGVTLDGNGNTLSFTTMQDDQHGRLVISGDQAVLKNITVASDDNEYPLQVYDAEGIVLENITVNGSKKGGILINSATAILQGKIDVSNNTWGGIEVSRSAGEWATLTPGLTIKAGTQLINTTEGARENATLWIDGYQCDLQGHGDIPTSVIDDQMENKLVSVQKCEGNTHQLLYYLQ